MTALYNADKLSVDSFLLNHSREYKIAAVVSWFEFVIEFYLFPAVKLQFVLSFVGLCLVIFGEIMRKLAMVTAKSNFTHLIQFTKRQQHILVTWGIYSWCRHPGYVGWFYWSIGMITVTFLYTILKHTL
jgi:protein-S-isoprenylcysteine O-methyltransferase